ncbi:putative HTH-type transcriptional regulator HI1009 [Agrobacterium tumefaciens str. Cherry 2E-2-2]|nr:putative HTH-type transcriptional regulator HI1009 [Agrobacterium tumefaciens str. Cherry 2E-2-2]
MTDHETNMTTEAPAEMNLSKTEKRRSEIIRMLMENGSAQIKDLAETLKVSLMTVHRDLNDLQDQGLVRRIRGSVSAEKSMLFESSYIYRARQHVDEKRRLARAAVRHIEPGNAVVWDDSSTTFQVCDFIEQVAPVTVLTNALPVIDRLRDVQDIELIGLGGKFHRSYNGFFGLACENMIRTFHVDVALLSTTTIQGLSLFTQDEQVVRAKQAMISIARKKILLVDESKFHYSALNYVAELSVFDVVLVSENVPADAIARMRQHGINIEIV